MLCPGESSKYVPQTSRISSLVSHTTEMLLETKKSAVQSLMHTHRVTLSEWILPSLSTVRWKKQRVTPFPVRGPSNSIQHIYVYLVGIWKDLICTCNQSLAHKIFLNIAYVFFTSLLDAFWNLESSRANSNQYKVDLLFCAAICHEIESLISAEEITLSSPDSLSEYTAGLIEVGNLKGCFNHLDTSFIFLLSTMRASIRTLIRISQTGCAQSISGVHSARQTVTVQRLKLKVIFRGIISTEQCTSESAVFNPIQLLTGMDILTNRFIELELNWDDLVQPLWCVLAHGCVCGADSHLEGRSNRKQSCASLQIQDFVRMVQRHPRLREGDYPELTVEEQHQAQTLRK
eukprot:308792_1